MSEVKITILGHTFIKILKKKVTLIISETQSIYFAYFNFFLQFLFGIPGGTVHIMNSTYKITGRKRAKAENSALFNRSAMIPIS